MFTERCAARSTGLQKELALGGPVSRHRVVGSLETPCDLVPVHDLPPFLQVLGAAVLVLQVIGMLPDVVHEEREMPLQQRIAVAGGGEHPQAPAVLLCARKPDPA